MAQQWRGPPWNAPIWPLIPLLLNRSIEVAALGLNNVFTSITVRCSDHTPLHPHTVSPHLGQQSSTPETCCRASLIQHIDCPSDWLCSAYYVTCSQGKGSLYSSFS